MTGFKALRAEGLQKGTPPGRADGVLQHLPPPGPA
jgi:hypothetical protein